MSASSVRGHFGSSTSLRNFSHPPHPKFRGGYFGLSSLVSKGSLNLSSKRDLAEAATNLFKYLHQLDKYAQEYGIKSIAVALEKTAYIEKQS